MPLAKYPPTEQTYKRTYRHTDTKSHAYKNTRTLFVSGGEFFFFFFWDCVVVVVWLGLFDIILWVELSMVLIFFSVDAIYAKVKKGSKAYLQHFIDATTSRLFYLIASRQVYARYIASVKVSELRL